MVKCISLIEMWGEKKMIYHKRQTKLKTYVKWEQKANDYLGYFSKAHLVFNGDIV